MSRRYDTRTTTFSPEGRLFQVEYAMEAISNAGSAIGVLAKDGVVLAAEKKITSKVLVARDVAATLAIVIFCAKAPVNANEPLNAAVGHQCGGCATGEDVQTR